MSQALTQITTELTPPAFKPMLAGKYDERRFNTIFPGFVQAKIDGLRALSINGVPWSRSLKPLPNLFVRKWFNEHKDFLNGLDGELVVGNPLDPKSFRETASGIMSHGGEPDFHYMVFDMLSPQPFTDRIAQVYFRARQIAQSGRLDLIRRIFPVETISVLNHEQVLEHESYFLSLGYEGAIIRRAFGLYKNGRSTSLGGELLKLKRFIDEEAEVIGFVELMHNENEPTQSNTGHQTRSSHQENMVAGDTLGALIVKNSQGQQFNIGTGFDFATRDEVWRNRDSYLGKQVTYRYVKVGGYDLPRFPTFHAFRPKGV